MADQQALHSFSQWVAGCSGDEKQEAQTFVQKLLIAWGWQDATEAGVGFEHRIPKGGAGGGMGFADALIPGKVLIEMKQRGEPLRSTFRNSSATGSTSLQSPPTQFSATSMSFGFMTSTSR
jgi:hypothetical protein